MSWADDGPDDDNHVRVTSLPQNVDEIDYHSLRALWDEFKEAYDLADEEMRVRLRSETECYL